MNTYHTRDEQPGVFWCVNIWYGPSDVHGVHTTHYSHAGWVKWNGERWQDTEGWSHWYGEAQRVTQD